MLGSKSRIDTPFLLAVGVMCFLRVIAYSFSVAGTLTGLIYESNPFAQLNLDFFGASLLGIFAMFLGITLFVRQYETRLLLYSFVLAILAGDATWDVLNIYYSIPVSFVSVVVWGICAAIPLFVGIHIVEKRYEQTWMKHVSAR